MNYYVYYKIEPKQLAELRRLVERLYNLSQCPNLHPLISLL